MLATDKYWRAACEAIELPDLAADPALASDAGRAPRMPEIRERIARAIAAKPLAHWSARLREAGCIFSWFATPTEVQSDPQVVANGYLPRHPTHPDRAARRQPGAVRRDADRDPPRRARQGRAHRRGARGARHRRGRARAKLRAAGAIA